MLDYPKAQSEMRSLFFTRFNDFIENGIPENDPPILPPVFRERGGATTYVPGIEWERIQKATVDKEGKHWLRFVSRNVTKAQKTLAGGREQVVGTQYTSNGIISVELYFNKQAFQTSDFDILNSIVERCFLQANTPGGIWFRNTVIVEMEPEETYFRSNVLTEYEFDSVIK